MVSKFEMMVGFVLNHYMILVDGKHVTKAEAHDAGRSIWFWFADGSGVQVSREAFNAMEIFAPDHLDTKQHTHGIRDVEGKAHSIVAAEIQTYDFAQAMRNTLWEWD